MVAFGTREGAILGDAMLIENEALWTPFRALYSDMQVIQSVIYILVNARIFDIQRLSIYGTEPDLSRRAQAGGVCETLDKTKQLERRQWRIATTSSDFRRFSRG
jgi:hypothetical protein